MANRHLNVIRAQRDLVYKFVTNESEKVGRLARFLSQQDSVLETGTLEIARLINKLDDPLSGLNPQPGDRLVLMEGSNELSQDSTTIPPGYKMLYFRSSSIEISSGGKTSLMLGRPDPSDPNYAQYSPDVDLTLFVVPDDLLAISRRSIKMEFNSEYKSWNLERVGSPELRINDRTEPLGLNEVITVDPKSQLRFYHEKRLIGAIEVDMQSVEDDSNQAQLKNGSFPVQVRVALEKSSAWLNVSETITLHQIADSLQYHWHVDGQQSQSLYLMHLVSPDAELSALPTVASGNTFLYAGKRFKSALNTLRLDNMLVSGKGFERKASSGEVNIALGIASIDGTSPKKIDLNLYEIMTENGKSEMARLNKVLANINYREGDGTWWLTAEDRSPLSIFVNLDHLQSGNSHQLDTDDVITFGPSIADYYSRLQVRLDTSSD